MIDRTYVTVAMQNGIFVNQDDELLKKQMTKFIDDLRELVEYHAGDLTEACGISSKDFFTNDRNADRIVSSLAEFLLQMRVAGQVQTRAHQLTKHHAEAWFDVD